MAFTLDELEVKISSNSAGASSGIRSLTDSLKLLSGVTKSSLTHLSSLSKELRTISESIKTINSTSGISKALSVKSTSNPFKTIAEDSEKARVNIKNYNKEVSKSEYRTRIEKGVPADEYLKNGGKNWAEENDKATKDFMDRWNAIEKKRQMPSVEEFKRNLQIAREQIAQRTGVSSLGTNEISSATSAIQQEAQSATQATTANEKLERAIAKLKNGASNISDGFSKLAEGIRKAFNRITRTVQMRAIRGAIKAITSGVKEGIGNLYKWSDALGGHFSQAMDKASSQFTFMKNSIATALAPAIEALIPVLTTVVGWFHEASNAVAQFIALLSGSGSWTKATLSMEKYGEATKKAGGATKDLLADWDELNIIQGKSGGGGASEVASDFKDMFQEMTEFDSKIKDVVGWVQEHMEAIKLSALAIGGIILGWKVSSAFSGVIGFLGSLASKVFTVSLGLTLAGDAGYEIGKEGLNAKNLTEGIIGLVASTIGGYQIGNMLGGNGLTGAVIGLTLGVAVGVAFYFKGIDDARKEAMWGDIELSAEEIQQKIQESFGGIDVRSEIDNIEFRIGNMKIAKDELNQSVEALTADINSVKIKAEIDTEDLKLLVNDAKMVVESTNKMLDLQKVNIKFALGIDDSTSEDGVTDTLQADIEQRFSSVATAIQQYVTGVGSTIAGYWDAGIKSGWKNGEADLIMEEITRLNDIQNKVNNARKLAELENGLRENGYTLGTTNEILRGDIQLLKEYEDSVRKEVGNSIVDAQSNLAFVTAIREQYKDDPTQYASWDAQVEEAKRVVDALVKNEEDIIEQRMQPAKQAVNDSIAELLAGGFENLDVNKIASYVGGHFDAETFWTAVFKSTGIDKSNLFFTDDIEESMLSLFGNDGLLKSIPNVASFAHDFAENLRSRGYSSDVIIQALKDMLGLDQTNILDFLGISFFGEGQEGRMTDAIFKAFGFDENSKSAVYKKLLNDGSSFDFISNILGVGEDGSANWYGTAWSEGIQQLKEDLQTVANEIDLEVSFTPVMNNGKGMSWKLDKGVSPNQVNIASNINGRNEVNADAIGTVIAGKITSVFPSNLDNKMNTLVANTTRIANKDTTVVVSPTTSLGLVNKISTHKYARHTGDD